MKAVRFPSSWQDLRASIFSCIVPIVSKGNVNFEYFNLSSYTYLDTLHLNILCYVSLVLVDLTQDLGHLMFLFWNKCFRHSKKIIAERIGKLHFLNLVQTVETHKVNYGTMVCLPWKYRGILVPNPMGWNLALVVLLSLFALFLFLPNFLIPITNLRPWSYILVIAPHAVHFFLQNISHATWPSLSYLFTNLLRPSPKLFMCSSVIALTTSSLSSSSTKVYFFAGWTGFFFTYRLLNKLVRKCPRKKNNSCVCSFSYFYDTASNPGYWHKFKHLLPIFVIFK